MRRLKTCTNDEQTNLFFARHTRRSAAHHIPYAYSIYVYSSVSGKFLLVWSPCIFILIIQIISYVCVYGSKSRKMVSSRCVVGKTKCLREQKKSIKQLLFWKRSLKSNAIILFISHIVIVFFFKFKSTQIYDLKNSRWTYKKKQNYDYKMKKKNY